ncbi:MAG TPA: Fic family protein [Phycisphaerales bacterium]|nr:Fic family protein [Phycisphaerales bacterium]
MRAEQFQKTVPGKLEPITLNKRVVRAGLPELVPIHTICFVPDPLPPKIDWAQAKIELFDLHGEALLALGRLNGLHKQLNNAAKLLRALWIREARQSSAVEGIHTTSQDMVLAGAERSTGVRSGAKEAWNYVRALEHGIASDFPTATRIICEMHALLLEGVDGEDKRPGSIRNINVMIQGEDSGPEHARFIPPPAGEPLLTCLREFEVFVNTPNPQIPALFAAAIAHYQFEAIHPFADGNGRIGRVLLSRSLVKSGILKHPVVYFSEYIRKNKLEYVDRLLAVSTHNAWTPWIRFILQAILHQSLDAITRSEQLIDLRERYLSSLKAEDAPMRYSRLIDRLFEIPAINAEEAQPILEVGNKTVYRDIELLEKLGILKEITGRQRARDWVAPGILHIIGSDSDLPTES